MQLRGQPKPPTFPNFSRSRSFLLKERLPTRRLPILAISSFRYRESLLVPTCDSRVLFPRFSLGKLPLDCSLRLQKEFLQELLAELWPTPQSRVHDPFALLERGPFRFSAPIWYAALFTALLLKVGSWRAAGIPGTSVPRQSFYVRFF